ncbi:MAG: NrdH-redoxin [Nitrospirae bacterium]|nr:NrdH-redoxin [Nitrospirota bacterium]
MAAFFFLLAIAGETSALAGTPLPDLEVFVRAGCPHCEAAKIFLDELRRERPSLQIAIYDIAENPAARQRLATLAAEQGIANIGVPAFLIRTELIIGFLSTDTTGAEIRARLDQRVQVDAASPVAESIKTTWFGELRVRDMGLPLFTIVIGLLDGFNPCSMWVLVFMLSLLASLANRTKMLLIGGTFVAVEGIAYFAFMAAWLNLFLLIGISRISELTLGGIGVLAGAVNIKDFLAFRRGISLGIPEETKPGLYEQIRRILQAENMVAAVVGTVLLAVLVQAVELLCTAGLPALYTRILTIHQLDRWGYYGYLALYNMAYMLDDVLVLAIGVITMSHYRLQEREGRWLKLISGLVMVGLGAILLLQPKWLI